MTISDEIELGKKFDDKVSQFLKRVNDPEIVGYVTQVTERVVKGMEPLPYPVKVAVIQDSAMNAFAVPGGYIYIFTGLIENLENEDQLAAIIAHELAHVSQRHVADRMEQMQTVNLAATLGMLAGALLGAGVGGDIGNSLAGAFTMGSMAGAQSAYLVYTRENEREADHVGMNYLLRSGYNPKAMVDGFEIMRRKRWYLGAGDMPAYLSTHPGIEERQHYIQDRIRRLNNPLYETQPMEVLNFKRAQALLLAHFTDPKLALARYQEIPEANMTCPDYMGMAIVQGRLHKLGKAKEFFNKALKCCDGQDPLILREAGRFAYQKGDIKDAEKFLAKSYALNPNDVNTWYYYARLLHERGEHDQAAKMMAKVLKYLPKDASVHNHLGRMHGAAGRYFEAYMHMAWAALHSRNPTRLKRYLEKAESLAETDAQREALEELKSAITKKKKNKS